MQTRNPRVRALVKISLGHADLLVVAACHEVSKRAEAYICRRAVR